jgi:Branched-chain amino acid transport protein (AzlD)
MNAVLNDGFGGYLVLLGLAVLVHEPWRWLGFIVGRHIDEGSEVFLWVRAVATALVAGLVMKLVVLPAGALAAVPGWMRATALLAALSAFVLFRRSLGAGVATGSLMLAALQIAFG